MTKLKQGDVIFVDLDPTKGVEVAKKRPCVVVSNQFYNRYLNTVLVVPISSSLKYQEPKYQESPLFIDLPENEVIHGTILTQHLRAIDPNRRITSKAVYALDEETLKELKTVLQHFI